MKTEVVFEDIVTNVIFVISKFSSEINRLTASYETLFFSQQKLVVAELLIARAIHDKQVISPL